MSVGATWLLGGARRFAVAGGALVVVAAAIVSGPADDSPAERPATPSNAAAPGTVPPKTDVVHVELERLDRRPVAPVDAARNPFRFHAPAPRPAARTERAVAKRAVPEERSLAREAVDPPPIPLQFIGFTDPEGDAPPVGTFSDGRGNVFHGRQGDIIEGRYRVLRIGSDSAELAYLDGRGRQTIRMAGP